MYRLIASFVLSVLMTSFVQAQTLTLDRTDNYDLRCTSFMYYEDKGGTLTADDIRQFPIDSFQVSDKDVFNFGYTTSTFWIITEVVNNTQESQFILEVGPSNLDRVDVYFNNQVLSKGDLEPFNVRDIKDPKPLFHINIPSGDTQSLLIRLNGADELVIPIHMASKDFMMSQSNLRQSLFGLFAGILLVMILYNLFLYFSLRTSIYLLYVLNILPLMVGQASLHGYSNMFFWPDSSYWPDQGPIVFPLLAIVFGVIFMTQFINLKKQLSWSIPFVMFFIGVALVGVVLSLIGYTTVASITLNANGMASAIFLIGVLAYLTKKGVNSAKFLLVAWIIFFAGVILYVLRSLSILEYSALTNYSMPLGAAIETVLLSFALADRINTLKKQREESQRLMLMEVKKNNDLTRNQNKILEEKVQQRTQELEVMNKDLEVTLADLKSTQGHLVEAEKMASLGQLTAGIAHEINNPINYVSSNVEPIRQDLGDILEILEDYKALAAKADAEELAKIKEKEQNIDLPYSIQEIKDLLGGIEEGAKRTAEIVTGLKNFSRTDEDEAQSADINNGLRSTITILKSELKNIKTNLDYGTLPHIKCYLGKLNQVFMNLVDNAIDAINVKHGESKQGVLTVKTAHVEDHVVITIADNGCGMDKQTQQHIFDPFYTTKDVGQGTGLGLSISYGIIEKHNGTITVSSEEGVGSTFTITLPINTEDNE